MKSQTNFMSICETGILIVLIYIYIYYIYIFSEYTKIVVPVVIIQSNSSSIDSASENACIKNNSSRCSNGRRNTNKIGNHSGL